MKPSKKKIIDRERERERERWKGKFFGMTISKVRNQRLKY